MKDRGTVLSSCSSKSGEPSPCPLNYGYTGTLLGLSPETLYKAGGMVAPEPTQYEIDNYYCDSEVDHYWIKKGIEQANKQGYIGLLDLPVDMIFKIL